jgi:hypothetical protein
MSGIEVQLIDRGPATFEVLVQSPDGSEFRLPRDHPEVLEIEELAYGRVLAREVRPLPAGTIRVRVPLDEHSELARADAETPALSPFIEDVAERVARRILA